MNTGRRHRHRLVLCIVGALLAGGAGSVSGQDNYPSRSIRIIVPLPPGATADTLPRIIGERLMARWGQAVVVENRPGAALNIGAEAVAKAEPDGYTLLASPPPPLAINQSLYPKLGFDPSAFAPVTVMAHLPNVLVVNPKVPASSLQELIALAKSNPDGLTYASSGNGSTPHLSMELLKVLAGIEIRHVPYKGLAPALTDLMATHVDMMFDNLGNVASPIQAGKLKGLGAGSATRIATLPGMPAISETFPGFASVTWFAIVAPPRTPNDIVDKLSRAVGDIIRQPDVAKRFADLSSSPIGSTPAETAAFIREERERWHKVIIAAKIKAD